jgi:hypothetical protein
MPNGGMICRLECSDVLRLHQDIKEEISEDIARLVESLACHLSKALGE